LKKVSYAQPRLHLFDQNSKNSNIMTYRELYFDVKAELSVSLLETSVSHDPSDFLQYPLKVIYKIT